MRHHRRALIAVVGLGALLGAACGGGGSTERVSRSAMIEAADAVCAAGLRDAERLRAQAQPGARGEAAAAEIDATLEVLRRQVDAFEDLRGPESTDAARERAVRQLDVVADGVEQLRAATIDDDLTVDEAIAANQAVVGRVNRASARAADALGALGFLTCIGIVGE